jgi:hypothetical protein
VSVLLIQFSAGAAKIENWNTALPDFGRRRPVLAQPGPLAGTFALLLQCLLLADAALIAVPVLTLGLLALLTLAACLFALVAQRLRFALGQAPRLFHALGVRLLAGPFPSSGVCLAALSRRAPRLFLARGGSLGKRGPFARRFATLRDVRRPCGGSSPDLTLALGFRLGLGVLGAPALLGFRLLGFGLLLQRLSLCR